MKTLTWYKSTTGLNVSVDATRIAYDPKTGVVDLAAAWNIDIDRSGRISRRKPHTKVADVDAESFWSDGNRAFYESGGSLYEFFEDFSSRGLRSGMTPKLPISFVNAGGNIYYANGMENGVIRENVSYVWIGPVYNGPESIYSISNYPPVGHLLSVHNAYMLVGVDNTIYWSMPYAYYRYRKSKDCVQMKGELSMLESLGTGVWVSCAQGVYWLHGPDPGVWIAQKKADTPAILGTAVVGDTIEINTGEDGFKKISDTGVMWTAGDGVYVGDDKGQIWNLTSKRLVYQSSNRGAAVRIKNKYIVS